MLTEPGRVTHQLRRLADRTDTGRATVCRPNALRPHRAPLTGLRRIKAAACDLVISGAAGHLDTVDAIAAILQTATRGRLTTVGRRAVSSESAVHLESSAASSALSPRLR